MEGIKHMSNGKNSRELWIDLLRIAAACGVVLLHTITGVMDTTDMSLWSTEQRVFLILMDWVTWSVPVFLMISGYLFLNPVKELSWRVVLTKYCRRIVLALFLFGVPYALLELIAVAETFQPIMVVEAIGMVLLGKSWAHMWYLYCILALYLITPFLKKLLRCLPVWGWCSILVVLTVGSVILPFVSGYTGKEFLQLPDDMVYLLYYLLGYALLYWRERNLSFWAKWKQNSIITAMTLAALFLLTAVSRSMEGYEIRMAYNYPPTVLIAVLIVVLAVQLEPVWKKKWKSEMEQLSSYSFTVYLIHPVYLNVCYKFLHLTPLLFPLYWSLPLFYVGALFCSLAGAWILCHIPLMKKYVL